MPKLTYVWCWPNGGSLEEWVGGSENRGVDAFARTSRRVTERYSESVASSGATARRANLQILLQARDPAEPSVALWTDVENRDGEIVRVEVPPAVADLTAQDRARLVLDVVDAALRLIAQARDWPAGVVADAYAHVVDHGFGAEMVGAWKANPSRSRCARPVAHIGEDGWGRLGFEVADARTGAHLGFTRSQPTTINSLPKFKRAMKWLWRDNSMIEHEQAWLTRPGGEWVGEVVQWGADALGPQPELELPDAHGTTLEIISRHRN